VLKVKLLKEIRVIKTETIPKAIVRPSHIPLLAPQPRDKVRGGENNLQSNP